VTVPGTDWAALALDRTITAPPAGATSVRVTVPVDEAPATTELGVAVTELSVTVGTGAGAGDGAEAGFQPSWTTSKSLAVSSRNAGFRMPLSQRLSNVPLTYMSDPLSATMSPYFCIARKIFRTLGSDVRSAGSLPFTVFLRRSRAPIGSAPVVDPARCDAG
jgi:hypothetical protein